jgi:hypothetical protein|nr:MAG TPA: hypothetical protein [Caudoviricetes sp.]
MAKEKEQKLEALQQLQDNSNTEVVNNEEIKEKQITTDLYKKIDKSDLPFNGMLYPESWQIAHRVPTPDEIAEFSTVNEDDQAGIVNAISELVRKCYIIYDVENKKQISSGELNDGEKMFFFLRLRESYLEDNAPIKYSVINQTYNETVEISFTSASLEYPELTEKLLQSFDGRKFSIKMPRIETPIQFYIPTVNLSQKIFKYILTTYKEIDNAQNGKKSKNSGDKTSIDKKFLLILPYLFETGEENIQSLKQKYLGIKNNPELYKAYITIANSLNLTNYEKITYIYKESEEEALIKFPMGWRKIFDDTESLSELFGI